MIHLLKIQNIVVGKSNVHEYANINDESGIRKKRLPLIIFSTIPVKEMIEEINDENSKRIAVEYFCNQDGSFCQQPDEGITRHCTREIESIGIFKSTNVKDAIVAKVEKAYSSYY